MTKEDVREFRHRLEQFEGRLDRLADLGVRPVWGGRITDARRDIEDALTEMELEIYGHLKLAERSALSEITGVEETAYVGGGDDECFRSVAG
jgi:hypothetical protein